MAADLRFRRANGTIVDKRAYLEDLQKPENTYEDLRSEDIDPKPFANVAVVTLRVRAKGKRGDTAFEGVF